MKKNKITNKKIYLFEGGKAILSVINRLQSFNPDKKLNAVKIPQHQLKVIFDEYILPILEELKNNKLIKSDYETDFSLGSTRLASYIAGKQSKLYASETPDIISQAIQKKQTFGDLDVDIQLENGVSIVDIGEFLQNKYPQSYAYKKINNSEISLAIVLDDGSVIQVDFVDVGNNPESVKFMQVSSILDISQNIKGYAQKILLSAILGAKKLSPQHQKIVDDFMNTNQDFIKAINYGYEPIPNKDGSIGRYSLSPSLEIYAVIDMKKSNLKTIKKFKTTEKPLIKFRSLDELVSFILPGQKVDSTISFIELLKYIKKYYPEDVISDIKKKFIKKLESQKSSLASEDVESIIKTTNQYI